MSFSKYSNLEAKSFATNEIKHQTTVFDNQNLENEAFYVGFMHLKTKMKENFKLKTKLIKAKV